MQSKENALAYIPPMQTYSRWGFAFGTTPNARGLRCRHQHVGIQKALWTQHEYHSTQHKNQSPQCNYHQPNASWWNIVCVVNFVLASHCPFHAVNFAGVG